MDRLMPCTPDDHQEGDDHRVDVPANGEAKNVSARVDTVQRALRGGILARRAGITVARARGSIANAAFRMCMRAPCAAKAWRRERTGRRQPSKSQVLGPLPPTHVAGR